MRSRASGLAALIAAVAAASCAPASAPAPIATTVITSPSAAGTLAADRIQILHTGDIHGHLEAATVGKFQQGGMANLAGLVSQLRARAPERTLLVDDGDAWVGTFVSAADKGQAATQMMSLMRYDAMTIGNHDFDWGPAVLAQRAAEAGFPFLAANLVDERTGGTPAFAKPYIVKDLGVAKVALLGLARADTAGITKAGNTAGLRFLPVVETTRRYLPGLRRLADIVVVVMHGAADSDRDVSAVQLAKDAPDIDVIIAGHDHIPLRSGRQVGTTLIVDAGAYTENLGHLELTIDPKTKKVVSSNRTEELTAVASGRVTPDPAIAKLVEARQAEGQKYTGRIIGTAVSAITVSRDESPMGNLVADALLEYGRAQGWKSDVAFYNAAGLRGAIAKGDITYGQLFEVLPFQDVIISVDMSGVQLRKVFEAVAAGAGRLTVSGAAFAYHFGSKDDHSLLSATVGGAAIDPARTYRVVTNDYLYGGGDGHDEFKAATNVIYGDTEADVVAGYIQKHSPVDPKVEGRVISR